MSRVISRAKHETTADVREPQPVRSENEATETSDAGRIAGVLVGTLIDLGESGGALVDFPGNTLPGPLAALSILPLGSHAVGRRVILMFEEGDRERPVVMGLVEDGSAKISQPIELSFDKKRLVLAAEEEIVLRCGNASITLTRAGKVLIRGAYVLTRSSGVNRIKGGSVQIN